MAFGSKSAEYAQKSGTGEGGEQQVFESQWMPTGNGTRLFRILPAVANDEVVMTPRMSGSGKELREGNKKTGAVLYGPEPSEETVFMYAWWKVMVDGAEKPKRLMLNANGHNARFNNPLWKYIEKNFPKGKDVPERKAIKLAFAINVWDMSPVLRNDKGQIFYQAEDGTYSLLALMNNGKLITDKSMLPANYKDSDAGEPLNKVRILEGSYGEPGGKHLFQQLADLVGTVEDADGLIRRLPEFDLRMKTTGEKLKTNRGIRNTSNFKPLDTAIALLPRYDLTEWTTAWPDEVIERLLDGEDYNEIIEEYHLLTFPKLAVAEGQETDYTDPNAYKSNNEESDFE